MCSAPAQTSTDGKIVIGVNDGLTEKAKCLNLQMIDLKTGKAGWKKTIPKGTGFDRALRLHPLDQRQHPRRGRLGQVRTASRWPTASSSSQGPTSGCKPFAFAGGPKLLAASSCPTSDYNKPKNQLSEVDPATGKPKWTYNAPVGWEIDKVYSASPVVVSLTQREPKKRAIIALKDNGTIRVADRRRQGQVPARAAAARSWSSARTSRAAPVSPPTRTPSTWRTEPAQAGKANEVVAFSLDTGKSKWRSPSGGDSQMTPLGMEGGNVLVYREASYDAGGAVATIAPTGGAPKVVLQHPASTAEIENTFYSPHMVYADGRFFLAAGRVSASNDAEEKETKTMMAFGK